MNYKTFEPHTELSAFVKCYWTLNSPKEISIEKQRIVPDGCMEMIFHYGDLYRQYDSAGNYIVQPKCFVFGQITHPLEIEPTGISQIFAIRFQPEGFTFLGKIPLHEMENRAVPLVEVFGEEGLVIEKAMMSAKTVKSKIELIETFLIKKLASQEVIDRAVKTSVEIILQSNGQFSIDELAEYAKVHRRQLERKFSKKIGLSPKQLSKIIRLQSTLKQLLNTEFESYTSIAYEGEYYDQAHFIKDFKEFTGVSPKNFYSNNLRMTSLFISEA